MAPEDAKRPSVGAGRRNVVYEQWTAPEAHEPQIPLWAVRYVAWHSEKEGLPVWVRSGDDIRTAAIKSPASA
jgi:hypothetical protein